MYGLHPKTGKQIRILQLDTSLWKDKKALVWDHDIVCTPGKKALILVLVAPTDADWLGSTTEWSSYKMIVASKAVLDTVGESRLKEMKIGNLICLEECEEMYPFLEGPWDGTAEDAGIIATMLLRYSFLYGLTYPSTRPHISIRAETPPKPTICFITQYYKPPQPRREKEIALCLLKNLANPLIDRVVLLNEKMYSLPSDPKLTQEVVGQRLTYAMVIRWIQQFAPPNTICVFANSDIYLDKSWSAIFDLEMRDRFLTLLRYEAEDGVPEEAHEIFGPRPDSQDTWVVLSDSVKSRTWDFASLDFPFGKGGCDNAINLEMLRAKFLVCNPSLTLKTHHVHSSQIRTYDPRDIVDKPMYLYLEPTGLQDMNPIFNPQPFKKITATPFSRQIIGPTEAQKVTFCTMLGKEESYVLTPAGPNTFAPEESLVVYKDAKVFQTHTGLAYTYSSLYVGRSEEGARAWSKAQVSGLTPSVYTEVGLVAPCPDDYVKNPQTYILKYLSKILLMREMQKGEFWSPRETPFLDALQLFQWGQPEVPVLPRDPGFQVWSKNALIMLAPKKETVTAEQIAVLRKCLRNPWQSTAEDHMVIVADDRVCTREFIKTVEAQKEVEVIWPETSLSLIYKKLTGARAVIFSGDISQWGWFWLLPREALVFEIQNEMIPNADCLHFCGAASLQHRLQIIPRGAVPVGKIVSFIFEQLNTSSPVPKMDDLPLIILPKGHEGFFAHANDSFREIVRLWEARGYVRVEEDETVYNVWLNGIGDTLLYDRPNYSWILKSPPEERRWRVALLGNPAPKTVLDKSWSFWARRPILVEQLQSEGLHKTSYTSRSQSLVFYGKIENGTQKERRTGFEWAEACSEFSMPIGTDGYPFTQEEYLRKLSQARFGLCLPGYGWKCHREIECMAMGCVPIVTEEVDMLHYANPPSLGTHYFIADTPAQALNLARTTTAETWERMSSACLAWSQANTSVDGLWALTQKLSAK
jgi:hypothetical protein